MSIRKEYTSSESQEFYDNKDKYGNTSGTTIKIIINEIYEDWTLFLKLIKLNKELKNNIRLS